MIRKSRTDRLLMLPNKISRGFTLIELLVVIAIMAIMAAIALPYMSDWVATQRVAAKAEQVANLFRYARGESVRRGTWILACPVAIKANTGEPNNTCLQVSDAAAKGLTAYTGSASNHELDANEAVKTVSLNQNGSNNKISWTTAIMNVGSSQPASVGEISQVVYLPNGMFGYYDSDTLTLSPGAIGYRIADSNSSRRFFWVVLDTAGRVSVCPKNSSASTVCQAFNDSDV